MNKAVVSLIILFFGLLIYFDPPSIRNKITFFAGDIVLRLILDKKEKRILDQIEESEKIRLEWLRMLGEELDSARK